MAGAKEISLDVAMTAFFFLDLLVFSIWKKNRKLKPKTFLSGQYYYYYYLFTVSLTLYTGIRLIPHLNTILTSLHPDSCSSRAISTCPSRTSANRSRTMSGGSHCEWVKNAFSKWSNEKKKKKNKALAMMPHFLQKQVHPTGERSYPRCCGTEEGFQWVGVEVCTSLGGRNLEKLTFSASLVLIITFKTLSLHFFLIKSQVCILLPLVFMDPSVKQLLLCIF